MSDDITRFSGEYAWLGNFFPVVVELDGELYPSVESTYQAAKTLDPAKRREISDAPAAGKAKRLGRQVKLRGDWESIKLDVMKGLLRQKFSESPLKEKLLDTYPLGLAEGNAWGDSWWGVCYPDLVSTGVGENMLGKLLMEVREELRRK
jgi:ribA/ribD-fused uncharacterized protein